MTRDVERMVPQLFVERHVAEQEMRPIAAVSSARRRGGGLEALSTALALALPPGTWLLGCVGVAAHAFRVRPVRVPGGSEATP